MLSVHTAFGATVRVIPTVCATVQLGETLKLRVVETDPDGMLAIGELKLAATTGAKVMRLSTPESRYFERSPAAATSTEPAEPKLSVRGMRSPSLSLAAFSIQKGHTDK